MPTKTDGLIDDCVRHIRDIADFPKKGVTFKDITPLLKNGALLRRVVDRIGEICKEENLKPDLLACPEARGFIFGAALAYHLGVGFIPIRKPSKLPFKTSRVEYDLEYGSDCMEMHVDAITPGQKVVLVDDLLATGGTTSACAKLLENVGAKVQGCIFLIELEFLNGRSKLQNYPTFSLIRY